MMRAGDKGSSYEALAKALTVLPRDLDWTLDIVGDGPERDAVHALFADFAPGRIVFHGEKTAPEIAALLSKASLYLWPGHGEAYGLAYLEAQAAGLPVLAENTAGVCEVVVDGVTGILTPPGNAQAYATALTQLSQDDKRRATMAAAARRFATIERALPAAAARLDLLLQQARGRPS